MVTSDRSTPRGPGSRDPGSPGSPSPHVLVRASAGTGKTYRLTGRFLELLLDGRHPSTLLAVTFTRKAAGEILDRVLVRLAKAAGSPQSAQELGRQIGRPVSCDECLDRLVELTQELHRLSISTLDGFFHRVVGAYRLDLGLGALQAVVGADDPRVEALRSQALDEACTQVADAGLDALVELVERLHRGDAQRSVTFGLRRLLLELYDVFREAPAPPVWARLQPEASPFAEGPQGAQELDALLEDLERAVADAPSKALARGLSGDLERATAGRYRDLLEKGVAKALLGGGLLEGQDAAAVSYNRQVVPGHLVELFRPLLGHARAVLLGRLAAQTEATHRLLATFHETYERLRRASGILLYSDLGHLLVEAALDEDQLFDLYFRLDAQIGHLLIDEFQDTSVTQWSVLEPIVDELLAYGDGSRSFLSVGDPKQAIYGWRGGRRELFDHLETHLRSRIEDPRFESLDRSYRSSPVVLEAVNRVFSSLAGVPVLDEFADVVEEWERQMTVHSSAHRDLFGEVRLVSSREAPVDDEEQLVSEPEVDEPPDEKDQHAQFVAFEVARLLEGAEGTVGVLVSTNRAVTRQLAALRAIGIDAAGEGAATLDDDADVRILLSALTLADHPGDTASALHVATTPLGQRLAFDGRPLAEWAQSASRTIRRELQSVPLPRLLSAWARELLGARHSESIGRLLELCATQPGGVQRTRELVELARSTRVEATSRRRVQVMTIHQAKGLEFDSVVLCELDRPLLGALDQLVDITRDEAIGPPTTIVRSSNKTIRSLHPLLSEANRQQRERRLVDDLCALYVAMTRARQRLWMFVQPRARTKAGVAAERLSFAAILRGTLASEVEPLELCEPGRELLSSRNDVRAAPPAGPRQPDGAPEPAEAATRHRSLWRAPKPGIWTRPSQELTTPRAHTGVADLLHPQDSTSLRRGRFFHAALRQVEWLASEDELRIDLERARREVGTAVATRQASDWLDELTNCLRVKDVRSSFERPEAAGSATLWRERRFLVRRGGRTISGTFDRVVVESDEAGVPRRVWLYELKTGRVGPRERQRYALQLDHYRAALARSLRCDESTIRRVLVCLDEGWRIELDDGELPTVSSTTVALPE